jgi:aminopeptidase N
MHATETQHRDALTQEEAEARVARVSNVRYDLHIQITPGAPTYKGEATIRFDLSGGGDTFLDYRGKHIEWLEINGKVLRALRVPPPVPEFRPAGHQSDLHAVGDGSNRMGTDHQQP